MRIVSKNSASAIIFVFIALSFFVYEKDGLHHQIQKRVQKMALVKQYAGKVDRVIINTSEIPPYCTGECDKITRMLITILGDKGQMKIAADVDVKKNKFKYLAFCTMDGTLVGRSKSTPVPEDGRYCK